MAIDSVRGAQQTQAPKKIEKKAKEEKTYDAGYLCDVVCTPKGNKAGYFYSPDGGPLLPV